MGDPGEWRTAGSLRRRIRASRSVAPNFRGLISCIEMHVADPSVFHSARSKILEAARSIIQKHHTCQRLRISRMWLRMEVRVALQWPVVWVRAPGPTRSRTGMSVNSVLVLKHAAFHRQTNGEGRCTFRIHTFAPSPCKSLIRQRYQACTSYLFGKGQMLMWPHERSTTAG